MSTSSSSESIGAGPFLKLVRGRRPSVSRKARFYVRKRPGVGNFSEQNWGISVSAVTTASGKLFRWVLEALFRVRPPAPTSVSTSSVRPSSNPSGVTPPAPRSTERGNTGDVVAEHEAVDLVGALISAHALQVVRVPERRILERDAVATEDRAGLAGDRDRFSRV